ncbi:sigma-70 family RNA polymerase sigma factor [Thermomicrobium sp. 4228-Ro]|uniref:RNA polymerase sigma factor n=1 Tax=Thermomicrobium sp. 4228-Ro TaxID=2993937 RepID=UPI00224902C9|nr:sigma-70 family RNA polymerase sigma factor [Thermomicrobium sp. 4228-Ro]MCX2727774.1 sigma-70 family RNA polymerase sigma factor [Thermomicrobium sp. 4228-Ro]
MHLSQPYRRILQWSGLARRARETTTELERASDELLVQRVVEGDIRAFELLYDRYARPVFSLAFRMLGDPGEAEELLQETFVRLWQQAARYDAHRGSFGSWLMSIAHNLAVDALRQRSRRPQRADFVDLATFPFHDIDERATALEAAEVSELRDRVRRALAQLPEPQRQVIELAYFGGLTHSEIATVLGEPIGTIKTRLRLAMQKLQVLLRDHPNGALGDG